MSKRWAHIALYVLIAIFVLSLLDKTCEPKVNFIPPEIAALAVTVLTAVAIASIVAGLNKANGEEQS